jgi:hypothetical protein
MGQKVGLQLGELISREREQITGLLSLRQLINQFAQPRASPKLLQQRRSDPQPVGQPKRYPGSSSSPRATKSLDSSMRPASASEKAWLK